MSAGKYAGRIQASYDEGARAGVSSTPTLLVGGRLYQGRFDSDAITRLVDSLAPRAASAQMIYRMGAALMSLVGSSCPPTSTSTRSAGSARSPAARGGCETVQTSQWSRFAGRRGRAHRPRGLRGCCSAVGAGRAPARARSSSAGRPRCSRRSPAAACCSRLYLTYLELFVIHAICRWCVGSAAIIVSILILALLALRRAPEPQAALSVSDRQSRRQPAGPSRRSPSARWAWSTATSAPARSTR